MTKLDLAVLARSAKENEHRLPLHPHHLARLPDDIRPHVFLEEGYGASLGLDDDSLRTLVGGIASRADLMARCDVVLLPKPQASDLLAMREGQTLWGWPHCVQDPEITQIAIDRRLTLIAFEAMNHWSADGAFLLHVFHKNNELAGYCSVLHALALTGNTGMYGRRLSAAVIGFGATARGAVTALIAHGVHDVEVLTQRGVTAVASPIHSARIVHFAPDEGGVRTSSVQTEDGPVPLPGFLAAHDIIVNCVLQDTSSPMTFLTEEDVPSLAPGTLVVDVSCDAGMGFSWARPTSFDDPTFVVGEHVTYYAVDHSPSYLWNSASWEISEALLPYVRDVIGGPAARDANVTLERAVEIRDGVFANPVVLAFQGRLPAYPHPIR